MEDGPIYCCTDMSKRANNSYCVGTPVVGQVDSIRKIQELCKAHEMWLHTEGHNLATLSLMAVPSNVMVSVSQFSIFILVLNSYLQLILYYVEQLHSLSNCPASCMHCYRCSVF